MTRLSIWNSSKKVAFLVILTCQNQAFSGSDFQYFGSQIDFWNEKQAPPPEAQEKRPTETTAGAGQDPGKFPWQKYLDPKNKEFFKEGDYTPPEPFMEVVKNPSDSNLKMWFAYLDKKNELTNRFQQRMKEYLAKNSVAIGSAGQDIIKTKLASLPTSDPDAKRYRFRMYFDSHCPHCKKMFGTLEDLQSRGFYVEAKQIDADPRGMEGLNIPISRATKGEIQEKDIQSVPVLLIGDLKKKEVYRLTGYQSTQNVFAAIQTSN